MPLQPGASLGHYEILSSLGAGGMGEVYRARDTKLGRDVAIKLLLDEVSGDPDRLARFEREARVLASLNHSNIATLHGFEADDDTHFLVMELVEGDTLADRIARGPLPLEEVVPLFVRIAEGLEAAHESGVIHRDLKPANIKVTPDGGVKILDFGLAKAMIADEGSTHSASASMSPTLTLAATQRGEILGTAAYMSPEQAKGAAVDRRTDVWAFGACLFEALTGRRTFKGSDASELLASVLMMEPDWDALPKNLPRKVETVLRRCLVKDGRDRLHDIADARIELETGDLGPGAAPDAELTEQAHRTHRRGLLALAAAAVVAAASIAALFVLDPTSGSSVSPPVVRFEIPLPPGQEFACPPAVSPDGSTLAVATRDANGRGRLYLRRTDAHELTLVADGHSLAHPFFSPDGSWIAFFSDLKLKKVAASGGAPVELADAKMPFGGAWEDGGTLVFAPSLNDGLRRVSEDGGAVEIVTRPDPGSFGYAHVFPKVLRPGSDLLFTIWAGRSDRSGYGRVSAAGEPEWLLRNRTEGVFTASGHLITHDSEARGLIATRWDGTEEPPAGGVPAIPSVFHRPEDGQPFVAVSDTGTLAYAAGDLDARSLAWIDRTGNVEPIPNTEGFVALPSLSPDGERAVYKRNQDLWLIHLSSGARTRLVPNDEGNSFAPVWTPDGEFVLFASNRSGDWDLYRISVGGTSSPETVLVREGFQTPKTISPTGDLIFQDRVPDKGDSDLWVLPVDGEPRPFLTSTFSEDLARFSPDGRFVAYASNESGSMEVYVTPFVGDGDKVPVSLNGGTQPAWSRDGRELFFRQAQDMMVVDVDTSNGFRAGPPRKLFDATALPSFFDQFEPSLDGERLLAVHRSPASIPNRLHVTLNWFQELNELAPPD